MKPDFRAETLVATLPFPIRAGGLFKFTSYTSSRLHLNIGHLPLQGLDPRHFVQTKGQFPSLSSADGISVHLTDVCDLGSELKVGGDATSSYSGAVLCLLLRVIVRHAVH
jgi:hypothetical protein